MPKVILKGKRRIYVFTDESEAELFQAKKNHEDAVNGTRWILINEGNKHKVVNVVE